MSWTLAVMLATAACGGSFGTIESRRADLGFVTDRSTAFIRSARGIERVSLDGRWSKKVFPPHFDVVDASADLSTFVLANPQGDMFLADAATGVTHEITAVNRMSTAVISPDGRTVAVSRHADFSLPQAQWSDDDTLYLIDVATLQVRIVPPVTRERASTLAWTADGSAVFEVMESDHPVQVIAITGNRSQLPAGVQPRADERFVSPLRTRSTCSRQIVAERWGTQIQVVGPAGTVTVVREIGRSRGFHDPRWTPDCAHVAFGFGGEIWLASASGSGEAARLKAGELLFFAPPFERI